MTLQQIIEKAAEKHMEDYFNSPETKDPGDHFTDGAVFATTDPLILQSLLKPFAEWVLKEGIEPGVMFTGWKNHHFIPAISYTTEELIAKYIQFITDKSKEDGQS